MRPREAGRPRTPQVSDVRLTTIFGDHDPRHCTVAIPGIGQDLVEEEFLPEVLSCSGKWNEGDNDKVLAVNIFYDRDEGTRGTVFMRFRRNADMEEWLDRMKDGDYGNGTYWGMICNRECLLAPAEVSADGRELKLDFPHDSVHPFRPRYLSQIWQYFNPDQLADALARMGWGKGKGKGGK